MMWSCSAPMTGPPNLGERMCSCDLHQDLRLGPGLLALEDVQVHLVAIEVRVVGRADAEVQPERLPRHDPHGVRHHAHPVQRRLPVEQDDVAVHAAGARR